VRSRDRIEGVGVWEFTLRKTGGLAFVINNHGSEVIASGIPNVFAFLICTAAVRTWCL
jgi:hypothetical protein